MAMYENEIRPERALLVSVDTGDFDAQVSIDELEELVKTALDTREIIEIK